MNNVTTQAISKEDISKVQFSTSEVLENEMAMRKRKSDLYRAMILGNVYHVKCKIVFASNEEIYKVETTVWASTENYVTLKGGTIIPVKSIVEVIL